MSISDFGVSGRSVWWRAKQSQFGLGGLVGYYFDRASVQAYVTSDVYANNYGSSKNIGANFRFTVPLWNPGGGPPPPPKPISQNEYVVDPANRNLKYGDASLR